MRKVEAETLSGHQRAFLRNMFTQHSAQGGMQKVSCRVIPANLLPTSIINFQRHRTANRQLALLYRYVVKMHVSLLGRVSDRRSKAWPRNAAGIAYLTTRLS